MKTLIYGLILVFYLKFVMFATILPPSDATLYGKFNQCNAFTYPRYEDRTYAAQQHINGKFIEDEWDEADDREFVMSLTNSKRRPGGCNFNELLTCTTSNNDSLTCNNTCGICSCNRYTSIEGLATGPPCLAIVGYPCKYCQNSQLFWFRTMDPDNMTVIVTGPTCMGNTTCTPIYKSGDKFVSVGDAAEKIKLTSGVVWNKPLVGILPPLHRYFLRNVLNVCVCPERFIRGFGTCTPEPKKPKKT